MFKEYTPMQYLAIDIANNYGLDKENFENRIEWVKNNINYLEDYTDKADEPILYAKAVRALRKAMSGKPVNHAVALDASCSGLSIMSAVMRCKNGAYLTGLIDPDNRVDGYTVLNQKINELVGNLTIARKDSKQAILTYYYGSKAVPKEIFGNNVKYFYQVLQKETKGANELMQYLLHTWDKEALAHGWVLPDRHHAYCPVLQTVEKRVSLPDWGYTPVVLVKENKPLDKSVSNSPNVIHSLDSYILRTMIRRCNYKPKQIKAVLNKLLTSTNTVDETITLNQEYQLNKIADISHLKEIYDNANYLNIELKHKLITIFTTMLKHPPFDLIVIHDSIASHPNHCNTMRYWYKEILAELSDSTVIDHILSQLFKCEVEFTKGASISHYIKQSNYALS